MKRALAQTLALAFIALPAMAALRVVFVDRAHPGGAGTLEQPFATIAEAQRTNPEVIYVAEAPEAYEENVSLRKGQMLIGSAFGLDAVRDELKFDIGEISVPAAKGTGPLIHGRITAPGDNVIAGCTVIADTASGVGVSVESSTGPVTLRTVFVRVSGSGFALYMGSNPFPLTWTNGAIDAAEKGTGILVNGGLGDVTFDHVAIGGDFSRAIEVRDRTGGNVVFRNAPIRIANASRDAIVAATSQGSVRIEVPLQIRTAGSRGVVVDRVQRFAISGGTSWIEATNGTALDLRDTTANVTLDHVDAHGVAPGRLPEGVIADKIRGKLEIDRIAVDNALSYGVRITQSADVHFTNIAIQGGGAVAGQVECPPDIVAQTNVRCRAGLYLRHVERGKFEHISIKSNDGVGVNANNLADVAFDDLHVERTGDNVNEPSLLIDETRGTLSFANCSFLDGAGGAVVIEQRFNNARISFDRCEMAAPQRLMGAPALVRASVEGAARLDLAFSVVDIHDNAAGAVRIDAAGKSVATLTLRDSQVHRVSSGVDLRVAATATGCLDAAGNQLAALDAPPLRLTAAPGASLHVVDLPSLAARNGGVRVVTDGGVASVGAPCR